MEVTHKDYRHHTTLSSTCSTEQSGNFMGRDAAGIKADRQEQPAPPEFNKVPLSRRFIHPFKAISHKIGSSAVKSAIIGLVHGGIVLACVGVATAFPTVTILSALGGLIKMAKNAAGHHSDALIEGAIKGVIISVAIALIPAVITATAATLAAFCVVAPLLTVLSIPQFIHNAVTWDEAKMNEWEKEVDVYWKDNKDELDDIKDMINGWVKFWLP